MYTVPAAACSMAVLYICTSCCMFHDCPISVPAAACSTTVFYVCTSCYMFQGCSLYLYQLLHVPGLFSLTVPAAACSMTVLYVCTVYCTWLSSVTVTDDVPWLSSLQYVCKGNVPWLFSIPVYVTDDVPCSITVLFILLKTILHCNFKFLKHFPSILGIFSTAKVRFL